MSVTTGTVVNLHNRLHVQRYALAQVLYLGCQCLILLWQLKETRRYVAVRNPHRQCKLLTTLSTHGRAFFGEYSGPKIGLPGLKRTKNGVKYYPPIPLEASIHAILGRRASRTVNPQVPGSSPGRGAKEYKEL